MSECRREMLAKNQNCAVEKCGCGSVHLTIGAFTVRLRHAEFEAISSAVTHASLRLAHNGGRLGKYLEG